MSTDGYCAGCYSEASKAGRAVRQTDICKYPLCAVCEQRMRNGLVHYRPSNGTEFEIFLSRCDRCRHWLDDSDNPLPGALEPPFRTCQWGVLDRLYRSMCEGSDHISNWFDPKDIDAANGRCPALCLRFTDRNDPNGDLRDPRWDVPGQMTFGDIDVPVERVPLTVGATP